MAGRICWETGNSKLETWILELGTVSDKIYIRDLALRCIIGVYPEERREKQDVIINIVLECDHSAAAKSDQLADAVVFLLQSDSITGQIVYVDGGQNLHS